MVSEFWIPDLDDAPHVLLHGDLSGNNIIVDGNLNIQR
jgi:aminoglycoside phosphotransferase (APT) family kinase protein